MWSRLWSHNWRGVWEVEAGGLSGPPGHPRLYDSMFKKKNQTLKSFIRWKDKRVRDVSLSLITPTQFTSQIMYLLLSRMGKAHGAAFDLRHCSNFLDLHITD